MTKSKYTREHKGNSLTTFSDNYTIVDIETTGFSPKYDSIIEIGAIKVKNNEIIDTFHSLVDPSQELDNFIVNLTGISNLKLSRSPKFKDIVNDFIQFIGNDIIVGHRVDFDINFLYDNIYNETGNYLTNDYIDTFRLSRKLYPQLAHHTLSDLLDLFSIIPDCEHRALEDCYSTFSIYNKLKESAIEKYGSCDEFSQEYINSLKKSHGSFNVKDMSTDKTDFDETHPLFGKNVVFTGTLERMNRKDACQIVLNYGGLLENGVTKKTNYLILGNNDYCSTIKDGKSSKQKKAEKYIEQGCDLMILPEDVFYDMIKS